MSFITILDSHGTVHTVNMFITVFALFTSSCCHGSWTLWASSPSIAMEPYLTNRQFIAYKLDLRSNLSPLMEEDLCTLLSTYPPPFIYIQDSESFKSTCLLVNSVISSIGQVPPPSSPSSLFSSSTPSIIIHSTRIDAVSTFTNRLLFESIINSLAGWDVNWEDGCSNWHVEGGDARWNENVDTFIHGLRAVHGYLCRKHGIKGNQNDTDIRLVIVIERAERLKETNPELVVPLTRLAEMASRKIPYSTQTHWL